MSKIIHFGNVELQTKCFLVIQKLILCYFPKINLTEERSIIIGMSIRGKNVNMYLLYILASNSKLNVQNCKHYAYTY